MLSGLSESTIRRMTGKDPVHDVVQSIHDASVQKPVPMIKKLDDFDKGVVRRTIHDMYRKSEVVTMPKLHATLKEKEINVSLSTVVRTVKELGFRFSKKGSNRRFVSQIYEAFISPEGMQV